MASQENSGVSAHRQGLLEALATSQTTMGGPVFFHRKHSHKSPLGISPIYVNVTIVMIEADAKYLMLMSPSGSLLEAPGTQFTQALQKNISLLDHGERCITS